MRKLVITAPAAFDLREIRRYTAKRYGRAAANTYGALLKYVLRDVRDDPFRSGSKQRPEIGASIRSYHVSLSRNRAGSPVRSPRHFVLYFLPNDDEVVISRILHDARDLARHVPDGHRDP